MVVRILLIHQNFPGQFRQLVPRLLNEGHELRAICSHQRPVPDGCLVARYCEPDPAVTQQQVPGLMVWAEALSRAPKVHGIAQAWKEQGWSPDLILGHSGWGETLLLEALWPDVPQVIWPELWVDALHAGILPPPQGAGPTPQQRLEHLARNQLTRAALERATAWVLPTRHQAQSLPIEFRTDQLHVIHEGIDTSIACPNPQASYVVRGIAIDRCVPTLTFVNRNLEPLRGFDQFMRSLPSILKRHPSLRVLIVGDNGSGYAGGGPGDRTLKQAMLEELGSQLDLERIHFLGRVPYPTLITLLQVSWVHVYLSKPFILGWSLLEAMACGCCVVGSEGMPVEEVIRHGQNGLLIPLGSPDRLATSVLDLLANAPLRERLGDQAREDSLGWDQNVVWPRFRALFGELVSSGSSGDRRRNSASI